MPSYTDATITTQAALHRELATLVRAAAADVSLRLGWGHP